MTAGLETYPDKLVSSRPPPEPTTTISNAGMDMGGTEEQENGNRAGAVRAKAREC